MVYRLVTLFDLFRANMDCTRSGSFGDSGHGMEGLVACDADLDETLLILDEIDIVQ